LEQAIETWEGGDLEEAKQKWNQALELAQKMSYL